MKRILVFSVLILLVLGCIGCLNPNREKERWEKRGRRILKIIPPNNAVTIEIERRVEFGDYEKDNPVLSITADYAVLDKEKRKIKVRKVRTINGRGIGNVVSNIVLNKETMDIFIPADIEYQVRTWKTIGTTRYYSEHSLSPSLPPQESR